MTRPSALAVLGVLALLSTLVAVACAPGEPEIRAIGTEAEVTGGLVRGRLAEDGIHVFEGIPFAAPPVEALRWAPPASVTPWEGVRDATAPGPICAQSPGPEGGFYTQELPETSEDCLTLNVWTAAETTAERRPVMYWIHGGGLTAGSGSEYPGEVLANKGVVLITVNYRLGPFGFFAHPELSAESGGASGNQGIRDQIAGLEWVRDNIATFGGDPGNVTIFGESAGSLSVSLLQASPLAKGLFHKAIGQSGGSFQPMARLAAATGYGESAEDTGESFGAEMLGGTAAAADPSLAEAGASLAEGGVSLTETGALLAEAGASLAALRALPSAEVLSAFQRFSAYERLAIVDGEVIPDDVTSIFARGDQSDVPVMVGSNADEGSTFLAYFEPQFGSGLEGLRNYAHATLPEVAEKALTVYSADNDEAASVAWSHLFADVLFTYPQRIWARSMESVSSPAYLYYFTWQPPVQGKRYGAFHAGEIGYVFGDLELFGAQPTDADREFSEVISDLWVRFAKTGDPNGGEIAGWEPYTVDNEAYFELGEEIALRSNLRMEQIELIDQAFEERREIRPTGAATGL